MDVEVVEHLDQEKSKLLLLGGGEGIEQVAANAGDMGRGEATMELPPFLCEACLNAVVAEELPGPGTVFLHVDWNFRAPVRPGDVITGRVEVIEVRSDKPITKLKTTVVRDDGVVAVDGDALCYTMPLPT